ncbi:Alcohol dehydrogenase class-3-like protein [Dinothrombium tinctorium]|uniref:Alcohol dehydrogenase class-3-like protein n=1 Tax=Dinothrombium tinctorium TaxID=1965070 RepID=A0A3S3PFS3_9ACAR|nr:Alcohol dehydrogenase class-3-like protein [Dinothrombium tinctorium]RWS02186.1 Alcohol dehydrogenase class-3-like protein [Dinothrombium tinctorium]
MSAETAGKVIKCRAAICWAPRKPLTIEEVEVDTPKVGEVRVKVVANGVCHSDLHVYKGDYENVEIRLKYPCILGHEAAGIVESIGEGVTSVSPGDHVITFFNAQCGECAFCKNPKTNMCLTRISDEEVMPDNQTRFKLNGKSVYHFCGISSLSEFIVLSEFKVGKINPKARLDRACIFSCGFATGYGSVVNLAKVEPNSKVAVWGMGTVGLSAVYGAYKSKAAIIIGVDTNDEKMEIAKKMGCTHFINPLKCKEENKTVVEAIKELTDGFGVDYAFDCVGHASCVRQAFDSTPIWGTTVVVGVSSPENKLSLDPNEFLYGKKLMGALLGGYKPRDCIPALVQEYVDGKHDIIENLFTGSVTLDEVDDAFQWLIQGKVLRTVVRY